MADQLKFNPFTGQLDLVTPPTVQVPVPSPRVELEVVAAVNLSGQRVVAPRADGLVVYADPMDSSFAERAMWFTEGAIMAAATGPVLAVGEWTDSSWTWVPGPIFLGPAGTLTQTPPVGAAFWLHVASAASATSLYFDPKMPIRLS